MELVEIRDIIMRRTKNYDIDDVDDAIKQAHYLYIMPATRKLTEQDYSVGDEVVDKNDIANDIYEITMIHKNGSIIPILSENEPGDYGVRFLGDNIHFQGVTGNVTIQYKKEIGLPDPEPEIDSQYHVLYALGASAIIEPDYMPVFLDRLHQYTINQTKKPRTTKARSWR